MITASELPHRVTIQQRTDTDDGGGGTTIAWSNLAVVWAHVAPGAGREFQAAQQQRPELSHTITLRYRPGITPKQRIIAKSGNGTRAFNIESVANSDEANVELVLMCSEIVAT